jgi:hypothetical protein
VNAYAGMELCTPTWLNHDYRDGGIMDILAMDAYSGVELCMPIFLGEASKSFLKKKIETKIDTSVNRAQHKQEFYAENILLW